jgi:hypothetical protein
MQKIDELKKRLRCHLEGIGTAHGAAELEVLEEQKRIAEKKLRAAEFERNAEERLAVALDFERRTKFDIQGMTRTANLKRAKFIANQRQSEEAKHYASKKLKKQIKDGEREEVQKGQMLIKIPPIESYPRAVEIKELGIVLPVNDEAISYENDLKRIQSEKRVLAKKREGEKHYRTTKAALRNRKWKNRQDLQEELTRIHQYEVDEQLLTQNLRRPAKEIAINQTYLVDTKAEQRTREIALYLEMSDPPFARPDVPQPLLVPQTTPNGSDDDI